MRELYDEYFYVPEDGKVRDKVMLARTALTVVIMLLCLFAMSITAYAYFSNDSTTHVSAIKTADYTLGVVVKNTETSEVQASISETEFKYELAPGEYTVILNKHGTASTGFCVINDIYHTQQIGVSGDEVVSSITFTLEISKQTTVTFKPHWGTSSKYGYSDQEADYIKDGGIFPLPAATNADATSDQPQTPQTPPVTQDD